MPDEKWIKVVGCSCSRVMVAARRKEKRKEKNREKEKKREKKKARDIYN
jgi:hypothetical protein